MWANSHEIVKSSNFIILLCKSSVSFSLQYPESSSAIAIWLTQMWITFCWFSNLILETLLSNVHLFLKVRSGYDFPYKHGWCRSSHSHIGRQLFKDPLSHLSPSLSYWGAARSDQNSFRLGHYSTIRVCERKGADSTQDCPTVDSESNWGWCLVSQS